MDRSSPASNKGSAPTNTSLPPSTPLMKAIAQITELTRGRTTVEQLAALAYTWGGRKSSHVPGYAVNFEKCKSAFLETVGRGKEMEARARFNNIVRAGIRAQLPPHLSMALEKAYQDCKQRHEDKLPGDGYKEMKAEMVTTIRQMQASLSTEAIETVSQPGPGQPETAAASTGDALPFITSTAVTASSAQAAMFIPASPLSAPPHLAFLDTFPSEWRARPAWVRVIASMDKYLSSFSSYRGDAQRSLLQSHAAELCKSVDSMALYTALAADEAGKVAYQREIVNIAMSRPFDKDANREVLGCEASRMMESEVAQKPGSQLSLSMRAPIRTVDGRVCRPVILSVSAPALDTAAQPEMKHYVRNGKLDAAAYRTSYETLASHIRQCAAMPANKGAQVVLSGFGLANFLAALSGSDKGAAVEIGADVLIQLIRDLRKDGVDVAYTDYSGTSPPWPAVNKALGTDGIKCLGSIPGDWIKDQQIIVNAWDPHALVGNGCAQDNSLDGYIGRNSLVHETHALACMLHANGFLP